MTAVIFDTESTGLNEPRVVEAGWLLVPDPMTLQVEKEFLQRYNPQKDIELGALATHHILDEELFKCPPYTEFKLPPVEYIVGHNIDYDWRVIGEPPVKRICVLALARSLLPPLTSYSQSAILYLLERYIARGLLKEAHSALQDVKNCLLIFSHLLRRMFPSGQVFTWEDVWLRSEQARIPTVMTFGKHKGTAIKDVPADYKRWLLGQPDVDPYLVQALRGEAA